MVELGGASDSVRVAVVGADPLARSGLSALLGTSSALDLVGEVAAGEGLVEALTALGADVVVWDLGPQPETAPEEIQALARAEIGVVVLGADGELAAEAFGAGALGALRRDARAERLHAAALAVAEGIVALDPDLARALFGSRPAATAPAETLTTRELEVLELLAEGLSNKLIAARLGISEHTVKFHVNAILSKLDAETRTEAVVRAARLGLLTL